MYKPDSVLKNETYKITGFWDINKSPKLDPKNRPSDNYQQKTKLAIPGDHREKIKDSE